MFRWTEVEPNHWRGKDGDHFYVVEVQPHELNVTSNGTADDFSRLFRLDEPVPLISHLQAKAGLPPDLHSSLIGLRLTRPADPVETVFSFLCTSNNHLPRIRQMVFKLAQYGKPMMQAAGWTPTRFPNLDRLARLDEGELRAQGFGYRGKTIPLAARALVERGGIDWLRAIKDLPLKNLRAELVRLPGVGPKLADCIALYALHRTDAVPVDTHLWQAACRQYFPKWIGASLTDSRYDKVGDMIRNQFGEWAGHAHLFLYFDNLLRSRSKGNQKR